VSLFSRSRKGGVVVPFPAWRVRPARPLTQVGNYAAGGKVVFLFERYPLRALASDGGLPPAA
jgi:hypothetical protein